MTIRILVSDKLSNDGLAILDAASVPYDFKVGLTADELKGIIGDYDGIIIRSATKLTADILDAAVKLKVVVRAGVGVDNVDLDHARKKGIAVMNTPGGATSAVAELALGMMLGLARTLTAADASMKAGRWEKKTMEGVQLADKTLGIIGLGRIGRKLAEYGRSLGMTTIGYDPIVAVGIEGIHKVSLDELFYQSDYISLHIPLTAESRHMISDGAISKMKKGVRIINCARGGVVDEEALRRALDSGHVAGAGLDVFEAEPPAAGSIAAHAKVIATPHVGAATKEAQSSVSSEAAELIVHYVNTGEIQNRVA